MKKWLSLAAATVVAVSFTACNDADDGVSGENAIQSIKFAGIATPTSDADKNAIKTTKSVTVNGTAQAISFTKLISTGDTNNGETFGQVKDYQDNPITFTDGSPYLCNGTNDGVGSGLDYTSILQKNNKLYMVGQFECQVGALYKAELNQDSTTGELSVKSGSLEFVSQKSDFGGYVHCAGQTTPWQSHLGSEEYEPNARSVEADADATTGLTGNKYYDEVAKYWGGDIKKASPYYYGWTPEVKIDSNGNAQFTKHYALGRMSHELSYVMPDNKTVYLSDDGTNVGLFMFKADNAMDLSSGTMYAAKWNQLSSANGGSAYINWIKLGSANNTEIKAILDPDSNVNTNDAPKFSDIFDTATPATDGSCATGYTSTNTSAGQECLKLKTTSTHAALTSAALIEKAAAFLETRRYASMKGATTEFRKEEGITYSATHNKLYVAMSAIERGMEDNKKAGVAETKYDIGGNNDIKLDYNYCGAVYELDVNNNYEATTMRAIVNGEMISTDANGNKCHLDKISNPDNVAMLEGTNLLMIGEDTSKHINNVVWTYNVVSGELTRVLTTPLGAETTSPFWYKNINGFSYMTAVSQHPNTDSSENGQSSVGVLGAIKNIK